MSALYHSILVVLLLVDGRVVLSSTRDLQPDSITYILKSYADAFTTTTTSTPTGTNKHFSTVVPSTARAESSNNVYSFPTPGPGDRYSSPSSEPRPAASKHDRNNVVPHDEDEADDHQEPPDHVIPYSEHEDPPEPATRPNYTAPGAWAKPPPDKNISLDFVPTKFYAQVRGTHTVEHVPREEALKSAETDEEKANAARLKEVVKISKANTVYSEEGYEDAAYDHAGQIRDADFHEGFARKLNDHIDLKDDTGSPPPRRYQKRPRRYKNRRPRKSKTRTYTDYRDHLESEARTYQKKVEPENLNILKTTLNNSIIDPKNVALSGISELDKDLKNESEEIEKTSTEPYSSASTLPVTSTKSSYDSSPTTHSILQSSYDPSSATPTAQSRSGHDFTLPDTSSISRSDFDTVTTTKRDIFTVRPKKYTTPWPNVYIKKRPMNYYGSSKNTQSFNSLNSYSDDDKPGKTGSSTTTESYENLLRQYVLNNPNLAPAVTYNPLAYATVNGHGPYLFVVGPSPPTKYPNTYEPLPQPANQYYTISHENRSNLATKNSFSDTSYERKNLRGEKASMKSSSDTDDEDEDDQEDKEKPKEQEEEENEFSNFEAEDETEKPAPSQDYEPVMDPYVHMQPPSPIDPYYPPPLLSVPQPLPRRPLMKNHWFVTHEKDHLVENAYSVVEPNVEGPPIRLRPIKRIALPLVTRLLPPAPLSASEYTSFQMRDRKTEILPPTVIAVIEAIHKNEQKTFPFLFRRKRSLLGPSREWEILQRDKKLQDSGNEGQRGSEKTEEYNSPRDFKRLLGESPQIALDVVDKEIKERFKNDSRENSSEASADASNSESDETTANLDADKDKESTTVEVSLPELDFSSTFDEDEEEEADREALSESPTIDRKKYPFYKNDAVLSTALEYVVDPSLVPQKTLGGMEFYDSRNRECEEIEPNLEKIVPENEDLENKRGPRKSKQRLTGLGDKLDCFKAKFFGDEPLDNPLFYEEEVKMPPIPEELNPKKFASRISKLPLESDEYVIQKGPKNPENYDTKRKAKTWSTPKQYATRPNYDTQPTYVPRTREPIPAKNRRPTGQKMSNSGRVIPEESKPKPKKKRKKSNLLPAYQTEVYEDVMGNIMRLEKSRRHPSSKYGLAPYQRVLERPREQGPPYASGKYAPQQIDGMLPPPKQVKGVNKPFKNNYRYPSDRDHYYDSNESAYPPSRIYKRSIDVESVKDKERSVNKLRGDKDDIFKMIYSTPKTKKLISDHRNLINQINNLKAPSTPLKHTNRSTQDIGRYDKFSENQNNSSNDYRRGEPRYNAPNANNKYSNSTNKTTVPEESSKSLSVTLKDLLAFASTFVPVIVKPDESTIHKLLKDNQKQIKNIDNKTKELEEFLGDNVPDIKKTDKLKNSKKRYSVKEGTSSDHDPVKSAYTLDPHIKEHKELNDFLEGEPPGYHKAFGSESTPEYEEDKPESIKKEESKVRRSYQKKDHSGEEDTSKESSKEDTSKSAEEGSKETNSAESSAENEDSREATQSDADERKNSTESSNEPFERYADRPDSPPENFEDDKYSELGPRINKPYFYHPPFEVPEYELSGYSKSIDRSDNADLNTSEETEDHETYIYPWEKDDKHDESKYIEPTSAYEYPWDKKKKDKSRRESSQEQHDAADEENSEEATNTQPIYIPIANKHVRGKKDVHNEEAAPDNDTLSKFSSKYKSKAIEIPLKDDDMITSSLSPDDDALTTQNYFKDSIVSRPTVKTRTTHKSITNDTYVITTDDDDNEPNQSDNSSTSSSSDPDKFGKTSSPTVPTTILDPRYRLRKNKDVLTRRSFSHTTQLHSTTPGFVRRRGRFRGNSTDASTSTTAPRRRTRPTAATASASSIVSTVSSDRRRRPFRIQSRTDSTPTSTVRTIAHHSRVSKQEIITKTTYPDEDDDEDGDDRRKSRKPAGSDNPTEFAKIRRGRRPKNDSTDGSKKKKVEKVVITMEETPDHVYETKEVDRDGVKGKFVTITANNNSDASSREEEDLHMQEAEIEEMNRRRSADNSFNNLMRDTEDLVDKSSGVEDYMAGDLLEKSTLVVPNKLNKGVKSSHNNTEEYGDNNDDEDENDEEEEDEDEVDDYEDHNNEDEENNDEEENEEEGENDGDKGTKKSEKESDSDKKELEDEIEPKDNKNITLAKKLEDHQERHENKTESPNKKHEGKTANESKNNTRRKTPNDKDKVSEGVRYPSRKKLEDAIKEKNDSKPSGRSKESKTSSNDDNTGSNRSNNSRRRKQEDSGKEKIQTKRSTSKTEAETVENQADVVKSIPGVIKDPSIRKYFYVE